MELEFKSVQWFSWKEENRTTQRKTLKTGKSQQQTQPTYEAGSVI